MKQWQRWLIRVCLLIGLLAAVLPALAQSGGGYNLSWNTLDGGGATFSTGGSYQVGGTIAQPDAGQQSGGNYVLRGGFWQSQGSTPTAITLNRVATGANSVGLIMVTLFVCLAAATLWLVRPRQQHLFIPFNRRIS